MTRGLQIGGILLLAAASAIAQKGNPKQKGAQAPPAQRMAPGKGGAKGGIPKGPGGPFLNNPANQFERLLAMPPEKRDQVIERLPPAQQERLRTRLDQFDRLPPQQKADRLEMLNRYFALPPEKQQAYSQQIQAFHNLEQPRRAVVVQELRRLWRLPESERQARLASEDFKARFSPAELEMLNTISAANILTK